MRRAIYECKGCDRHCTLRVHADERPYKCMYWAEKANWVRIDKHEQKVMYEYRMECPICGCERTPEYRATKRKKGIEISVIMHCKECKLSETVYHEADKASN